MKKSLNKIITKLVGGQDKRAMHKAILSSDSTRNLEGHIWVDYLFLGACYASAIGEDKQKLDLVEQIKGGFPNYDPSVRFAEMTYDKLFEGTEETGPDHVPIERLQYVLPLKGAFNQFCDAHPDFSFEEAFGKYFNMKHRIEIKNED